MKERIGGRYGMVLEIWIVFAEEKREKRQTRCLSRFRVKLSGNWPPITVAYSIHQTKGLSHQGSHY